jgi:predicted phosphodiesterase
MRVAVISDIHANCFALDATLDDLEQYPVDQVICLGDVVQGGAQPRQTITRLRELACPVVMGNADSWLLTEESDTIEPTTQQQREVRAWTLAELSSADLDYVRGFQRTLEVSLSHEQRLLCFHGSPNSFDDVLLPETSKEDWDRLLGPFSPAIMAGGHTHTQQIRRVHDGLFFNPGSIGVAYNYYLTKEQFHIDAWAEYAVLSYGDGSMSLSFHRVPYNVQKLIRIIEASGRPNANAMVNDYRR